MTRSRGLERDYQAALVPEITPLKIKLVSLVLARVLVPLAKTYAGKAIELDPTLAEPHATLSGLAAAHRDTTAS